MIDEFVNWIRAEYERAKKGFQGVAICDLLVPKKSHKKKKPAFRKKKIQIDCKFFFSNGKENFISFR